MNKCAWICYVRIITDRGVARGVLGVPEGGGAGGGGEEGGGGGRREGGGGGGGGEVSIFKATSLRYLLLTKQLLVIWNNPPPLLKMLATPLTEHVAFQFTPDFPIFSSAKLLD